MIVEISNQLKPDVNILIEGTLKNCHDFLLSKKVISADKKINFSVAVVEESEMGRINNKYRKKNEPTDVLSFQYDNSEAGLDGEIVLCVSIIEKNATEDGVAFEDELKKNLVHGFLHNLGYEHGVEMFSLQEEALNAL